MYRSLRLSSFATLLLGLLLMTGCDSVSTPQGDSGDNKITSQITSDTTLAGGETHVVTGLIGISNGATLTIEPGATLEFQSGAGLSVKGDGSALVASGTSSEGITMTGATKQAGFWAGIGINSSNANNELSNVTIEYAGGKDIYTFINGTAALQLKNGSALTLSNSTIRNNANYGLSAQKNVDLSGFSGNTFESNGTTSMNVFAANMGSLDAGTSYGSYVHVNNGSISGETQTIAAIGVPYRIAGLRPIDSSSDVTVKAGATFEFESGAGLAINGDGTVFKAQGTSSKGITMTGTTEQSGFWAGVGINSANANNELSHVTIEYAGGKEIYTFINGTAALQLKNGSAVTLRNSTIRNNANYGLSAQKNVDLSGFSGNTFESNETTSMNVFAANMGSLDAGTSYGSYVRVNNGSISGETQTIAAIGVPYRIAGVRTIDSGSNVTVEAGTTFEFESGAGLAINDGSTVFKAQGTSSTDITFTGVTKQKGFWKGIGFNSGNTNNELSNVVVEYAGGSDIYTFTAAGNIQVSGGAKLTLTNSIIQDSGSWGLASKDGASAVTESGNTYRNNADGARNF